MSFGKNLNRSLVVIILLTVAGCSALFHEEAKTTPLPDKKLENVVGIVMHSSNHYTFIIRKPNATEIEKVEFDNIFPTFVDDVPKEKSMWVNIKSYKWEHQTIYDIVEIHIHTFSRQKIARPN